jgi:hypothetical protein
MPLLAPNYKDGAKPERTPSMAADPILLLAGAWLGAASGALAVLTAAGYLRRWGIRFRLVGITSFTALLALSCLAFAVSYTPRVVVEGAVSVPVVFDNGSDLVIAAAPPDLPAGAAAPSVEQVARNLRGSGRGSGDGQVIVRLRRVEAKEPGLSEPVVLAEARRDLRSGEVSVTIAPAGRPAS